MAQELPDCLISADAGVNSDYLPQRVVCLQPSATATLAGLGLLSRVVACTRWCLDVCPEVAEYKPVIVEDSWTARSGEILGAKPDLVIAAVPYQEKALAEILKARIRLLALAPRTLSDISGDIATVARTLGAEERGQEIILKMQAEITRVREIAARAARRPRVFCEEWGKPIIRSQQWVAELVDAAGGEFVGSPGRQATPEEVGASDADVIVCAWCGAGDRVPLEKIVSQRGWESLSAVNQRRVYCVPDEFLNTPALTLLEGLKALAWAIHPELFPRPGRVRRIQDKTAQALP